MEEVEKCFWKNAKKTIYNHDKPYTKKIKYFNKFNADIIVEKPIGLYCSAGLQRGGRKIKVESN